VRIAGSRNTEPARADRAGQQPLYLPGKAPHGALRPHPVQVSRAPPQVERGQAAGLQAARVPFCFAACVAIASMSAGLRQS